MEQIRNSSARRYIKIKDLSTYRRPGAYGWRPTRSPTAMRSSPPQSCRETSSRTEPSRAPRL
ncbi:hypothetical protein GQ55_9G062100 [Panicum hallii var. hallii]|uniref:Uncharacterized protein n=1 Tax=Panicum hallii var. hallii TaxID=1504633 RepID=A0A2T7C083_9POAL|nr:hypothetical protein GQ55_9G062100 [Panicum hallii var. hallii]